MIAQPNGRRRRETAADTRPSAIGNPSEACAECQHERREHLVAGGCMAQDCECPCFETEEPFLPGGRR